MNLADFVKNCLDPVIKLPTEIYKEQWPFPEVKKTAADEYILRQGHRSDHYYFLKSGAVRLFYHDAEGNAVTSWVINEQHILYLHPCLFTENGRINVNVQAIDNSELIRISLFKFNKLLARFPELNTLCKRLEEQYIRQLIKYTETLKTEPAYPRFKAMTEIFKGLDPDKYKNSLISLYNIKRTSYYECLSQWREEL